MWTVTWMHLCAVSMRTCGTQEHAQEDAGVLLSLSPLLPWDRVSLSLLPHIPSLLSLNPEPTISARFVGLQTAYIFLSLPPTVIGLHRQPHALYVDAGDLDADPGEIDSDTHAWPKVLWTRQLFLQPLEYILFIFNCNFRLIFSS